MSDEQVQEGSDDRPPRRPSGVGDVLDRVAAVLGAGTDVRDLLGGLASLSLELTSADRASVFLLEEGRLVPVVAFGRDPDRWDAGSFQSMPPIEVDGRRAAALMAGATVAVPDAATEPLVPRAWVDIFALESLVLVPVLGDGEPVGLIALDWQDAAFAREDLRLVEAVAAFAGAAVAAVRRSSRGTRRQRLDETRRRAGVAFARACTAGDVARAAATALIGVTGVPVRAVAVVEADTDEVTTLRPGSTPVTEPVAAGVGDAVRELLAGADVHEPGWLADLVDGEAPGLRRPLAAPLGGEGRTVGALVVACDWRDPLDGEELAALRDVADTAAAALERIRDQRQQAQAEVREVARQLLGALSLLARRHAEVLPEGSSEARHAMRLADLSGAGRWSVEDAVRILDRLSGPDEGRSGP